MSGIVLIAPALAILASLVAIAAVRVFIRVCHINANTKVAGRGVALLMFPIASIFFFWLLPQITTDCGVHASAETANEHLLTVKIPSTAKDVDYRSAILSGLTDAADFSIPESEFLRWMSENNRTPVGFEFANKQLKWSDGENHFDFGQPQVTSVSNILNGNSDEDVQPAHGYYWDDYNPRGNDDSGVTVIYDAATQRAYVRVTTF